MAHRSFSQPSANSDAVAVALRIVLRSPGLGLSHQARAELQRLAAERKQSRWLFFMVEVEFTRRLVEQVTGGHRAGKTLAVWLVALSYAEMNRGRVAATTEEIARLTHTTPGEVSRALSHLARLGALRRVARGCYEIDPRTGWRGCLEERAAAAQQVPFPSVSGGEDHGRAA